MTSATRFTNRHARTGHLFATVVALVLGVGSLQYSSAAQAHHGDAFIGGLVGGLVLGGLFAPRLYYPSYYYYGPPVVYAPAPPVYYNPPVVVERAYPAPPRTYPRLSVEDRLRRLHRLCEQGYLTDAECRARREQILREL